MQSKEKERATAKATQSQNHSHSTTKIPQWQVVLDELIASGEDGITSWDMITKHHITRTAAHIATLRKWGYEIASINETNNGVTYARYIFISDEDVEEDDDDCENVDSLIEEIWETTGKWVTPAQLEARERYEAHGTWRNTRGW